MSRAPSSRLWTQPIHFPNPGQKEPIVPTGTINDPFRTPKPAKIKATSNVSLNFVEHITKYVIRTQFHHRICACFALIFCGLIGYCMPYSFDLLNIFYTAKVMPDYVFSLIHNFLYKDRIQDSVFTWGKTNQRQSVFWHILQSVRYTTTLNQRKKSHK